MEGETNTEKEEEESTKKERKEEGKPNRREKHVQCNNRQDRFFLALTVRYCLLVFRLWFEGWVGTTVLVKSPERLF